MKAYLNVLEVSGGQFSGESSIRLKDYTGEETSGFFENEHIKDGKLEVSVVLENDGLVLIKLPGRTLEGVGDKGYMTVRKQDIEYTYKKDEGRVLCVLKPKDIHE